jgi:hypothetical protein
MSRWRVVCALVAAMAVAAAQRPTTVVELVSFIKDSIKRKQDDRLVADYLLKRMRMKERLDEKTVETLEGLGAGPRTTQALRKLSKESANLGEAAPPAPVVAPPPPPPPPAPPSSVEQEAILDEIRANAINYSNNLPNFLCTQVTRRSADPTGSGDHWKQLDTIQEQLSFFDHREKYVVTMMNGQPVTNRDHQKLGGATSEGEFGSMLYDIFNPATEADFHWEKWTTWHGRRTHIYSFEVSQQRSRYDIYHGPSDRHVVSAYKGLVYADAETRNVMRIVMECVNLPYDFPIQAVTQELRYKIAKIADQEFLLPEISELNSRENHYLVKNVISYHLYRKFSVEDKISYDAIPDDKTKEEPEKPPVKKQP